MTKVVRPKMTSHIDLLTRTFCRRNWRGVSDTSRQAGMSAARKRLWRIGRATGARTFYYITATISMKSDPLKSRALMQLDHFVKRSYRERNLLLMMDEPELNLHPERQRALARFLVLLMMMRGVGVAISTHSDYIVKEINTLLMFGSDDASTAAIMQRYGYQESEVLRTEDVACGVAEERTIKTYGPSKEDGFALPNFDTTIELMNEIQDAIRWEDKA